MTLKYDTFLIVGGAGFIGSHLIDYLVESGAEKVVILDNFFLGRMENLQDALKKGHVIIYREDARYYTALDNIISIEKPEVVYDLAVKPLPYSFIDPESAFMTSVEIAQNLVMLLKKKAYSKLIHFSSSECYGTAKKIPMREDHPLDPTSPYGAGKIAADLLLTSYHQMFNLDLSIIRPFNQYGERQNIGAYAAIIPITIRRILRGEKPVIEWDGLQSRDLTYVRDTVEAAVKMLDCKEAIGKIINIGQGEETSIKQIVQAICEEMKYPFSNVEYRPKRPGDVRRHMADISLAWALLDWKPKTSLKEGLKKTIASFKNNMKT